MFFCIRVFSVKLYRRHLPQVYAILPKYILLKYYDGCNQNVLDYQMGSQYFFTN